MSTGVLISETGEVLVNELGEALTTDVPTTRFGLEGYGVRRAGSFGGKAGLDGHPVSQITRFGLEGYGVRRAGSFAGKQAAGTGPHPVGIITRFGLEGYGVRRAGSFAGKAQATPEEVTPPRRGGGFHPTKAEKARNRIRQRQIQSLFATPLSWLDRKPSERREVIEELQEAVQEAIEDVAAIKANGSILVPQLPSIDWDAIARQKREFKRVGQQLEETLKRLDEMIEMANDEDDIEILLLS